MTSRLIIAFALMTLSWFAVADSKTSFYCPQNRGYISIGMSYEQVMSACGQPITREYSKEPLTQRVPVQQLLFNNLRSAKPFNGGWQSRNGSNRGGQLEVNIVDNKVHSVLINNSSVNSFSLCRGANIEVGDPVAKVYSYCGNPSLINNTFIKQPVPGNQKPEVWIYQPGQYQPPLSLTFVNGKLQSID
jgi:Protein of unknown function (DUF2845)